VEGEGRAGLRGWIGVGFFLHLVGSFGLCFFVGFLGLYYHIKFVFFGFEICLGVWNGMYDRFFL
jgi:hypothetical protein